ncbi:hypothetical protein [Burkholderia pseudomallei]|uniref:hypothetical protein n=2 Tax=Burkholderia TaxID=32008 RepID=UPI00053848C6|nr:hypothetical protein [Burkholderia pseudomallei]KGX19860.1 hypothetical protein X896_821 [Burkholderia pseudomallei ABCPW 1]
MSAASLPLAPTNPDGQPLILMMSPVYNNLGQLTPMKLLYGRGAPANNVGNDGDSYINLDNSFMFGPKTGGVWPNGYSIKGDKGDKGDTGDVNKTPIARMNVTGNGLDLDLSTGIGCFNATINAPQTAITISNPATDANFVRSFSLVLKQGTGSNKVNSWPAIIKWNGGVPPVLSYAQGVSDAFMFETYDGGKSYVGYFVGNNIPA